MTTNLPTASEPGSRPGLLWQQVADAIGADIESKAPGEQLASEAEHSLRFGVSRVTVRQALQHLQDHGLIESQAGRGWFVAARSDSSAGQSGRRPLYERPGKLMSFSDMARSQGVTPDSVVLEKRVRPSTFDEAESLGIVPGAEVFVLRRLRRLDRLAVAVDRSLIPLAVLPDALGTDFSRASLHDCFRAANAGPAMAEAEAEATIADPEYAQLLEVAEGFPLLKVRQAFFDAAGRPIERAVIVYRSDRYRFRTRLQA